MWFLVLTGEKERAERILDRAGVQNFRLRSTTTEEVPRYIRIFDLGFLLRRNHIVNRVACPMKWLEYWQSGVPLVTTRAVEIVAEAGNPEFNCTIDIDDFETAAQRIVAWLSRSEPERLRIRNELVRRVEDSWSWVQGEKAIAKVFDTLENLRSPCRHPWRQKSFYEGPRME